MIDLSGRVALVTGGARGIGWACVQALAAAGAQVGLTWCQSEEAARDAVTELSEGGFEGAGFSLDLGQEASAERAVGKVLERFGRVDVLVNNAGIWNLSPRSVVELEGGDIRRMLSVNLEGTMQVTRFVLEDMLGRDWGRVISIGSTAGIRGEPGHSHYAASKGALFAWTRSLAREVASKGITANVVSPGWVYTDMTKDVLTAAKLAALEEEIPTGRVTRADEVAAAVLFLASPESAQITGINLDINGGAVFS